MKEFLVFNLRVNAKHIVKADQVIYKDNAFILVDNANNGLAAYPISDFCIVCKENFSKET